MNGDGLEVVVVTAGDNATTAVGEGATTEGQGQGQGQSKSNSMIEMKDDDSSIAGGTRASLA